MLPVLDYLGFFHVLNKHDLKKYVAWCSGATESKESISFKASHKECITQISKNFIKRSFEVQIEQLLFVTSKVLTNGNNAEVLSIE